MRLEPLARADGGVEAEVEVGEQLRHGQEDGADLGVLGLGEGLFEDGAEDGADAGEVVKEGRADGVEVADGDRDEGVDDFARDLAPFADGGAAGREQDHAQELDRRDDVGRLEAEPVLFHVEGDGRRFFEVLRQVRVHVHHAVADGRLGDDVAVPEDFGQEGLVLQSRSAGAEVVHGVLQDAV